jgi:hypothetical protein
MSVIVGGVNTNPPVRMRRRRRVIRQAQAASECCGQKRIPDKLMFPVMDQSRIPFKINLTTDGPLR